MLYIQEFNHCIFDFDGVIVDSEKKKFKDLQKILKKYNFYLEEEKFIDFIGKKRAYFIKELNNQELNKSLKEIMIEVHEKDFQLEKYKLTKGIIDFLEFLKIKKIEAHIATGSSEEFVIKILNKFKIKKYFTHIITGNQVSESKPSPKIYLELLKKIKGETFVIEDSPAGILSAKNAGLFVVSLIQHEKTDFYVQDFKELLKNLK